MEERNPVVSFGFIEVREYLRCLGNNPAVTHGPPLSIDWEYCELGRFPLDEYESTRPPHRCTNEMLIPGEVRESILLEQTDATRRDIKAMRLEIEAARHQRKVSIATQEFEEFNIMMQSIRRKLKRLKTGVSKKREEQLLWENAKEFLAKQQSTTPLKRSQVRPA